jgi:SAM-dependent methyltransferase
MADKNKYSADSVNKVREKRIEYLWLNYQNILRCKNILDVGADECYLKKWLDADAQYWGIGLGGSVDQSFDLESGPLPFPDKSFDVVLCLDVLEHLEKIHFVFDELCRVSKQYVIVSLPNCLGFLWRVLTRYGGETEHSLMRYYGLPLEPPADRHRWFFDVYDAERFIRQKALKNQMEVVDIEFPLPPFKPTLKKRLLLKLATRVLINKKIDLKRLYSGPAWGVLERKKDNTC